MKPVALPALAFVTLGAMAAGAAAIGGGRTSAGAPGAEGHSLPLAGGTLAGKVVWSAEKLPERPALDTTSKPEHAERCAKAPDQLSEELLVDPATKGVANVFVEVRVKGSQAKWKLEGEVPASDQEYCRFIPHVLVVPVGLPLKFKNSDPFLHNVHFYSKKNPAENFGVPESGEKEIVFKQEEKIRLKCDVHAWMSGVIIATENPYHALTGPDGSFKIDGIPPGKHEVRFWHEKLGDWKVKDFEVKEGANALDARSSEFQP